MSKHTKIMSNLSWRFAERFGAKLVEFIVSLVLARLLEPELYGTIAIVTVFITVMQVFVDSGLGNALIQKKDADDLDFSSVFCFNVVICLAIYILVFFAAPLVADFYNNAELTAIIRVLGLTIVISGVKNVQQAYVSRTLQFKRFFVATLGGTIGAAILGIAMAINGYGVWSLVAQQLFNAAVDTIILWLTIKWRPKRMFSFKRLRALFAYGWKLLVSSLLNQIYLEIRQLIIGKVYSSADLAQYNRGRQFPGFLVTNINSAIDSVLLPVMSQEQDNTEKVKFMTRRSISVSTFLLAPLMIGLIATGTPMVRLILTEKWLPCLPFMTIFCLTYMFQPIHTANLNAIKAMGRSDLFLKLEIIKKVVGLIALAITIPISVMAMAYSLLFTSISSQIINSWPNKKLLNYGYIEQLKDILPGILLAVFMGLCIYPIQWIGLPDVVTLLIQVLLGIGIYVSGSILFKLESFRYLWGIMKPYIKKVTVKK